MKVGSVIEAVFLVGLIVLLIASTLLIANTIRLSIFARRREIEVMKLVGATNWFVRGPFMIEGLLCGLIGSVGAIVLLLVSRRSCRHSQLGERHFEHLGTRLRADGARHPRRRAAARRSGIGAHAAPVPPRLIERATAALPLGPPHASSRLHRRRKLRPVGNETVPNE